MTSCRGAGFGALSRCRSVPSYGKTGDVVIPWSQASAPIVLAPCEEARCSVSVRVRLCPPSRQAAWLGVWMYCFSLTPSSCWYFGCREGRRGAISFLSRFSLHSLFLCRPRKHPPMDFGSLKLLYGSMTDSGQPLHQRFSDCCPAARVVPPLEGPSDYLHSSCLA